MKSFLAKFKPRGNRSDPSNDLTTADPGLVTVQPLSGSPTKAWEKLKGTNKVIEVEPMDLDTPISPDKIRFVCVSDTHSKTHQMNHPIPNGDVFINAGDFTNLGHTNEVKAFNKFLGTLPHPHKIVIAGNHELTFDPSLKDDSKLQFTRDFDYDLKINPRELLTNCTYLEDSAIEIFGLKIYGSPWQPWYGNWAFNLNRGADCLEKWNLIPDDTDILITHGPPIGHGDRCVSGERAGCVELLTTIRERVKPKFHIFGHIHEGYGITTNGTTTFMNASTCTLMYKPSNPPIIFDVPLPAGITK